MCIGVPLKVLSVEGQTAIVDHNGEHEQISLLMLDEPVKVGDFLLVQVGNFAAQLLTSEQAKEMQDALAMLFAPAPLAPSK